MWRAEKLMSNHESLVVYLQSRELQAIGRARLSARAGSQGSASTVTDLSERADVFSVRGWRITFTLGKCDEVFAVHSCRTLE